MNSHSENAKIRKNEQIPIAKREKRAWCQNRRFTERNVLKKICKIAELPQRKHRLRSTNAQKPHRRISDSWVLLLLLLLLLFSITMTAIPTATVTTTTAVGGPSDAPSVQGVGHRPPLYCIKGTPWNFAFSKPYKKLHA